MNIAGIIRILVLGAKSLWMHRLRSVLTTLGIVFGVCSVIAMLAIGEGASRFAQAQIARLGSNNIIIMTVKPPELQDTASSDAQQMQDYGLTYADVERFEATIPNVDIIVPLRRTNERAQYRARSTAVEVIGTAPTYTSVSPLRLYMGRFISRHDVEAQQKVCVIDTGVYDALFVFDDPLDAFINIRGSSYRVIGVVGMAAEVASGDDSGPTEQLRAGGGGVAGNVYLPLSTVRSRFGEIEIQVGSGGASIERVELQQITVSVHTAGERNLMERVLTVRDMLESLLARWHPRKDYQIVVPIELLRQAERTQAIFSIVLGAIASISLLVGGIGIMNIMLATVSERTREIGIRRALGARKRDIITQFLSETVLLTTIGGLVGIALGVTIPQLISHFGNMPTVITPTSLILAFVISGATGVIFGLYPALRAANMDPVEALRHE